MRAFLAGLIVCCSWRLAPADDASRFSAEQIEFFEKRVRPLLAEHCHKCHGPNEQKGSLRLDSRAGVLKGGDSGPAVSLSQPEAGELLLAVSYDPGGYQMPPDGKLSDEAIADLRTWVAMGAPWPAEGAAAAREGDAWPEEFDRRRRHWSFQPLLRPPVPQVADADWCINPIDRFLLARLESQELSHAAEADRRTWLRRATFDVVGLPPAAEEIQAFLHDAAPGAHERAIDRLLASPHFGERWGRHWLDLARYAESRGHEFDYDVANPWPYRDYVVRAINDDVPYDRFVIEHVAGDLLSVARPASGGEVDAAGDPRHSGCNARYPSRLDPSTGANESIVATGFWLLGEWVHSPVDIRQEEAERFDNMIDAYSKTFLGLTVACARCHDHKFDPIPQTDYYALQGYLQSSWYAQVRFETRDHNRSIAAALEELDQQAAGRLLPLMAELAAPVAERLDQYLLAAFDLLRSGISEGTSLAAITPQLDEHISALATARSLDAAVLRHWATHLIAASRQPDDPFHVWGLFATNRLHTLDEIPQRLAAAGSPESEALRSWIGEATKNGRSLDVEQFRSDGASFRFIDRRDPAIELGTDPERPLDRIEPGGFIEYIAAVGDLPNAPGATAEAGKLGSLDRGGRTLRSPTFEITTDFVHCEVRGDCHTYVVVDSHALINGPLHGSLLQVHQAPAGHEHEWRWIKHDVSRYRGHGAHVEFTPPRGKPFAVRQVVLADQIPDGAASPAPLMTRPLPSGGVESKEELARRYRRHWRLARDRSGIDELSAAEWARRHPELFGLDSDESRRTFRAIAGPLIENRRQLEAKLRGESQLAPVLLDGSGEDEYLFIRGNWKKRGEVVPRRFLSAFGDVQREGSRTGNDVSVEVTPTALDSQLATPAGSGRLELALEMVDPRQTPIVPRVVVNRIWQHYFGRGIVPTPDDFGHLGLPPSHPELLDWLACELVEHDWSLKHIHRLILTSAAYRMASEWNLDGPDPREETLAALDAQLSTDPTNTLLWRMNVKRLEGEIIRDALLAISGGLDPVLYGPAVPVHLTPFLEGRGRPAVSGPVDGDGRRSLYIAVRRNFPDPFFQAFDFPNPHTTIGRRNVSNVPAQALALMNNAMVVEQSERTARRLLETSPAATGNDRLRALCVTAYGREPTAAELTIAHEFLVAQSEALGCEVDDPRVWADYVHVLFNAKEFVFVR